MGNTFGRIFRISTWGESHGGGVGVTVDGCPAGLALEPADLQIELDRRRPGQSALTTSRREGDEVRILSGVFEGRTLGTPILAMVENHDARPGAYEHLRDVYRPSHADYTYEAKFGHRSWQGGGRASARETVGRVAGGAVARQLLARDLGLEIHAWVAQVADVDANVDPGTVNRAAVEASPVRCPDPEAAARMVARIEEARSQGDSVGGVVEAVVGGVPAGLGEPVFDRVEALLGGAMLGIPASKGFEIGSGFGGTRLSGAAHNDPFHVEGGRVRTRTNRSGGVQGGITNGEDLLFRVAFKPTATIAKPQETVDRSLGPVTLEARGRHDPCVLPRAVPIVEAMTALVMVDLYLLQRARHPERLPAPPDPGAPEQPG